jgi:hypothetical protein
LIRPVVETITIRESTRIFPKIIRVNSRLLADLSSPPATATVASPPARRLRAGSNRERRNGAVVGRRQLTALGQTREQALLNLAPAGSFGRAIGQSLAGGKILQGLLPATLFAGYFPWYRGQWEWERSLSRLRRRLCCGRPGSGERGDERRQHQESKESSFHGQFSFRILFVAAIEANQPPDFIGLELVLRPTASPASARA